MRPTIRAIRCPGSALPGAGRGFLRATATTAGALFLLAAMTLACAEPMRVISVDGTLTEIVHELGSGKQLVGVDTESEYPATTKDIDKVGHKHALSADSILRLRPDLLLATEGAAPSEVFEQLKLAGVTTRIIPDTPTVAGLHAKIAAVAEALGRPERGKALSDSIDADLEILQSVTEGASVRPRVLFLLDVGPGTDLGAGRDTAADAVIRLAGAENLLHNAFSGYGPLGAETPVSADPDVILVTQGNLDRLGGVQGVISHGGFDVNRAGRSPLVLAMDDALLLSFGPRLGTAVAVLACQLGSIFEDAHAYPQALTAQRL